MIFAHPATLTTIKLARLQLEKLDVWIFGWVYLQWQIVR